MLCDIRLVKPQRPVWSYLLGTELLIGRQACVEEFDGDWVSVVADQTRGPFEIEGLRFADGCARVEDCNGHSGTDRDVA
ncbi:hypothetical protein Actkin_02187 [Actinokineospora sp. UTMC 2448]|nr:hypothetical protein Actkin_02187 [Actinokineospora sp. UTMC 2448]